MAEDTRVAKQLCRHLEIEKEIISNYQYNEKKNKEKVIEFLKNGKSIGLITDRGTPLISDPGYEIVKEVINKKYNVVGLPGPTALIPALIVSGLKPQPFAFFGFLDNKETKRKKELEKIKKLDITIIIYEAPHRLSKTLDSLFEYLGDRKLTIVRELTKQYEEINQTTLERAAKQYKEQTVKGEFVLIIDGRSWEKIDLKNREQWLSISLIEHMDYYEGQGIKRNEAMRKVAKDRGLSKREVYNELLKYKKTP